MKRQRARTGFERWLTLDETDAELPISAEDRVRISSEATQLWMRSPKGITAYLALMGCCVGLFYLICWVVRSLTPGLGDWAWAIAMAVLLPTFLTGMWAIKRLGYSRVLFFVLRTRGFNICLNCGYWMKGLDADVACPECGWGREE